MTTLTKPQQELLDAAMNNKKSGSIFVQGPTFRTATALVQKGLGTFTPVSTVTRNRGWFTASPTMAQEAEAFRTMSDESYADLVNGRITAEEATKKIPSKPRLDTITPGSIVTLRFGGSRSLGNDAWEEQFRFVGIEGEGDERNATFEDVNATTPSRGTWSAYRYNKRWAYGTSAEPLSLVSVDDE